MTVVFVASGGGHLKQLRHLSQRMPQLAGERAIWVTYDTPQAHSLLGEEQVVYGYHPTTRSVPNLLRNAWLANGLLKREEKGYLLSTGAGIAVPFLALGTRLGWSAHYIESATRVSGASLSGRILQRVDGVHLYSQYRSWSNLNWCYAGSVFDGFEVLTGEPRAVRRLVVSLGTHELFGFERLLRRLVAVIPQDTEVLWQVGSTSTHGLRHRGAPITACPSLDSHTFERMIRKADAVVAHAGTGIALTTLECGKLPVLVPRRAGLGEHVDDHQLELGHDLAKRGLALLRDADELCWEDIEQAAACRVAEAESLPPFRLAGLVSVATPIQAKAAGI